MLFKLTKNLKIRISRPIRLEIKQKPQLELKLQSMKRIDVPEPPDGYTLRLYKPGDESQIVSLLNRSGISFNGAQLIDSLSICLPKGCFMIEHIKTKTIVSMMMARHLANVDHPFGGRIDWLSTDPKHTGLGLGTISAGSATKRLQEAGYDDIWVTTDDHRIGALKVFYRIGFRPVIYQGMLNRWRNVYKTLKLDQVDLEKYII